MDDRTRALVEARRRLLAQAPAERLDALLSAPRPRELVRALPAQELYLTLHASGLDRALPLLTLSSRHQLDFLFDIDAWTAGELDPSRAGHWLEAFGQADADLVARWLAEGDETTVVLVLSRLVRVYKLDESTSEDRWPPDHALPTLDSLYFLDGHDGVDDATLTALWNGLTVLRSRNRGAYEALLEQVLWMIPAELEEAAWNGRWSRLAERGFPEADEAAEVRSAGRDAHPASRAEHVRVLLARAEKHAAPESSGDDRTGRPLPTAILPGTAFARAASRLDAASREDVAHQLVRLSNRFAVTDLGDLGDPVTHARALEEASRMAGLGLGVAMAESKSRGAGPQDEDALAAALLATTPVAEVARLGVGGVEQRATHARHLAFGGWLDRVHRASERLDDALADVLEGLLLPHPRLHVDGDERPFETPADLAHVDRALDIIDAFGEFLEVHLEAGSDEIPELAALTGHPEDAAQEVSWTAVALTSLARLALGEAPRPRPLSDEAAGRAVAILLTPARGDETELRRLADENALGPAATHLEDRLKEDAPAFQSGTIDSRFVRALLLAPSRA